MSYLIELTDLSEIHQFVVLEPVRFVFPSPERSGPGISEIRRALVLKGRLRLSGDAQHTFADVVPGDAEPCLIALDTIVRSDAVGLQRMLLSVLPYVDEIVLGIDDRSDLETRAVAQAYADCVHVFHAADLNMTADAWAQDKIDFAAARNLGRARVHAPWTLVVDSDEYVRGEADLRDLVSKAVADEGAFSPLVCITNNGEPVFEHRDFQRLARTQYRWAQASHNQLVCLTQVEPEHIDLFIVSDTSLRTAEMVARRNEQRNKGIQDLLVDADKGHLDALFHVAKHTAGAGDLVEAVRLCEEFRARVLPNTARVAQRQWVALALGSRFVHEENFAEANRWACRVLLDGPSAAAFCMLGDIAEHECDWARALRWYQAACAVDDDDRVGWPGATDQRWERLEWIKQVLRQPPADPRDDPEPSGSASAA